MLVIDSEQAARNYLLGTRERNRERLRNAQRDAEWKDAHAKNLMGPLEACLGKPLHHMELMRRLQKCNPKLYFELSKTTGRFGIYLKDGASRGTFECPGVRYLSMTIARGMCTEFTPPVIREDKTLASVEHGYRSVLSRLIRQGYITEPQAFKYFGPPSRDSERWQLSIT